MKNDHGISDRNEIKKIIKEEKKEFNRIFKDIMPQRSVYSIIKVVGGRPFVVPAENKPQRVCSERSTKIFSMTFEGDGVRLEPSRGKMWIDFAD